MSNAITVYDNKALTDIATGFIGEGKTALTLPPNYDYRSAVNALYLQCANLRTADGKLALEVCTRESIVQTVQDMLIKGLSPLKKQCYPIVYAQRDKDTKRVICYELQLQSSYFGNQKQVYTNNTDIVRGSIHAQCIYKGDEFEYEIVEGRRVVTKHKQSFENIKDENIIGAYATAKYKDGKTVSDIMTVAEIKKSWAMSRNAGNVHQNFTHEMCCKTVKSRLAKHLNNSTDDGTLVGAEPLDGMEPLSEHEEIMDANELYEDGQFVVNGDGEIIDEEPSEEELEEVYLATHEPVEDEEEAPPVQEEKPEPKGKVCAECGKPLSDKVYQFSMNCYNRPLCMSCQKAHT